MMSALEVSTDLSVDEARAVVGRIRQCVAITAAEVKVAFAGRAWLALGYESWAALCAAEFGEFQLRGEARQALVADLREDGMSIRAIAAVTGAATNTVMADLRQVSQSETPDDGEIVEGEIVYEPVRPTNVTGLDGKRYNPPSPRAAPQPVGESPAEERARHLHEAMERDVKRVEQFCSVWHVIRDLRDSPWRDDVLSRLVDSDRRILDEAEELLWKD